MKARRKFMRTLMQAAAGLALAPFSLARELAGKARVLA